MTMVTYRHVKILLVSLALVQPLMVILYFHCVVVDEKYHYSWMNGTANHVLLEEFKLSPTTVLVRDPNPLSSIGSSEKHSTRIVHDSNGYNDNNNYTTSKSQPQQQQQLQQDLTRYEQCRQTVQDLKARSHSNSNSNWDRNAHSNYYPIQQRTSIVEATEEANAGNGDQEQYHICSYGNETIRMPYTPTLMILGAQKAGTTSLYFYLRQHPNIKASRSREAQFFRTRMGHVQRYAREFGLVLPTSHDKIGSSANNNNNNNNVTAISPSIINSRQVEEEFWCVAREHYYENVFGGTAERLSVVAQNDYARNNNDKTNEDEEEGGEEDDGSSDEEDTSTIQLVTFERTPSYLRSWEVPRLVQNICPGTHKFVIVLRNPIDRAYSHYQMEVQTIPGQTNQTFDYYVRHEIQEIQEIRRQQQQQEQEGSDLSICDVDETCLPQERHSKNDDNTDLTTDDEPFSSSLSLSKTKTKNYIRFGIYAPQVHHWFQYYPRSEFLILNYDALDRNTTDVYRRIVEFAGLSANHLLDMMEGGDTNSRTMRKMFRRYNAGNHHKKEKRVKQNKNMAVGNSSSSTSTTNNNKSQRRLGIPMSNATRAYLQSFFESYNAELFKELDGKEWNSVQWT